MLRVKVNFIFVVLFIAGCATESHRAVEPQKIQLSTGYAGPKTALVVGKFQNRSTYMQGLFSSSADKLGNQAKTILKTHLQLTNRFSVVDRENMENIKAEAAISGAQQTLIGAGYVVTGDVTEFGRKATGDHQLFGILGASKKQTAYAKVSLNVVNVKTSEIVYSTQGAGEYSLSNREVVGFGGTASYDATLNGKVLNFAIMESVNNLVSDLNSGVWTVN
jgi:curli biogenesis system outer membrane secretion channel CsgG